jgi:hypothetical protein
MLVGLLQMTAAVVSLYFLLQTGMSQLTVAGVAATCILTTVSVLLFGGRRDKP